MSDDSKFETGSASPEVPEASNLNFAKAEGGNMLVFGLCIFVVMLLASGMAIDFMRHENERTQLQSTLDRAILAAADLDQTLDPETVVRDYFDKANLGNIDLDIDAAPSATHRRVEASAKASVRSMFLNMVGINRLDAPAQGAAEERVNNVEISLILDVSGSMGSASSAGGSTKIAYLRESGQNFIDTILLPSTKGRVSVSLVPYTGQTNAGASLMEYYNLDRVHDYSNCIEFTDSDFSEAKIDFTAVQEQSQHFGWGGVAGTRLSEALCSTADQDEIIPFQNSNADLNGRIASFKPRTYTGIHTAMKWGVEMLHPEFNTVVQGMIADELIDPVFANRPVAFDDPETNKIIVLMTDGVNVDQTRLRESEYDTPEEIAHWATTAISNPALDGEAASRIKIQDATTRVNGRHSSDENLLEICQVARDNGVTVFTIGFELGDSEQGRAVLAACASSDAHAYEAEGINLNSTFSAVARTITQLRLTK